MVQRTDCSKIIHDTRERRQFKKSRQLTEMTRKKRERFAHAHSFQAQDGLLHTAHIGDVVFIGAEFSLLDPFINACDHLSGDVCSIIHT